MRKLFSILCLCFTLGAIAQDADTTKIWDSGLQGSLSFSQVSLSNWAGGGANSISLNSFIKIHAHRKVNRSVWENNLDMAYGLTKLGEASLRKSDDKVDFTSKYGYQLLASSEKLLFSSSFQFRSQFANGFNFPNDSVKISKFLAPGYIIVSTGLDYKPVPGFSIYLSPVTGKMTIVGDDRLASLGAFGVDPGENVRMEFGSFFKLIYSKEVVTNVAFETKLDLFSNYAHNPGDIDVNWENALVMKINDFLSANLLTQLIYDRDIKFDVIENDVVVGQEDKV
ncbi:MAG: DUF3078 domain-containing protein [Bacteroidetes bacterium]|nr:DUF3078 domain-containing protein [Bacteroidota bacterium]MDA1119132.1 DUF3078 domain-containing protein [Bacteroidota bacterium]